MKYRFGTCLAVAAGLLASAPLHAQEREGAISATELSDREEIRTLLLEYGRAFDDRRLEDYANLFAQQGEWVGSSMQARGPAEILAMMRNSFGKSPPNSERPNYHIMTNIIVDTDGDKGTAWSRWTFYSVGQDGRPFIAAAGRYEDELIREGGKWKFLRRRALNDFNYAPSSSPKAGQ